MRHVLFIYESIPEKTYVFTMDVDGKTYIRLLKANNSYINLDATDEQAAIINDFVYNADFRLKSFVTEEKVDFDRKIDAMIRFGIAC